MLSRLAAQGPPDPADLTPPLMIGEYQIIGKLGQGGMSVVYQAWHPALNRLVAVKLLRGTDWSPELLTRFRLEAEAMAQLRHPNIVAIYDTRTHGDEPYLVLEYMDGGPLHRRLAGRPQPPRLAAAVTRTLAEAIAHAHRLGVIHRDLKPENVLIHSGLKSEAAELESAFGGVLKLTDFGLAKLMSDGSSGTDRAILGTPNYMAPEQAAGGDVGSSADIYGLGGILYTLLTGRPPFMGDSTAETLRLITSTTPVPPRMLCPRLPRELELICLKCLEKDPNRRYVSAEQLADDLDRFLTGRPVSVRPLGPTGQGWKFARRNPVTSLLLTLLATVIIVSLVGLHNLYRQAESRREQAEMARRSAEAAQALAEQSLAEQNAIAQFLTKVIPELARPRPGRPPADKFTLKAALVELAERVPSEFRDQPRVAAKLELSLGVTFRHLGELALAERCLLRARERLATLAKNYPADAEDIENSLAVLYISQGKSEQAVSIHEELWHARQTRLGPDHPETLTSRHNLAMALRESGKAVESVDHLKAVLAARNRCCRRATSTRSPRPPLWLRP